MSALPPDAERFLRDLERALAPLPRDERVDVVAELRSHLLDRAAAGRDAELLEPFGAPEEYARTFLEERALAGALAAGTSWGIGRVLAAQARTAAAIAAVAGIAVLHVVGVALVACAALKPFWPGQVGLLVAPGHGWALGAAFGFARAGSRELLGWWAIPAFLVPGILLLWAGRRAVRALARRRLARLRAGVVTR